MTWGVSRLEGLPPAPEILSLKAACEARKRPSPRPQRAGRVVTADGFVLTGLAGLTSSEPEPPRAPDTCWVPLEAFPAVVIGAFLAAEDSRFYEHRGVSLSAVLRALYLNLSAGRVVQGGSTISQQVAKMTLGRARTVEGKVDEALLARRIEQHYNKSEILEAYLNRIFLGAGSYGVAAAARRYFQKPLEALTPAEAALLAGLTVAPSRLNPLRAPELAKQRRRTILNRMMALGLLDLEAWEAANASPLLPVPAQAAPPAPEPALASPTPYAPDLVALARREVGARWPHVAFESLDIRLNISLVAQVQARDHLKSQAFSIAARRGDSALLWRLSAGGRARYLARSQGLIPAILVPGEPYVALVTGAPDASGAVSAVAGAHRLRLSASGAEVGDLRLVTPRRFTLAGHGSDVEVDPYPVTSVQGAFVAFDLARGEVLALVGGTDLGRSSFNRALDACRPPGSVFKVVPYALALRGGLTLGTMLSDSPLHLVDREGRPIWTPRNADRDHRGPLTLAQSFASSRNIPAIRLVMELGAGAVVTFARHLGLRAHRLRPSLALALGSDCVEPFEMIAAFAPFARAGHPLSPEVLRMVSDPTHPKPLVDRGFAADPFVSTPERLARLFAAGSAPQEDTPALLSPAVAFLMHTLLRRVVTHGTARAADQPQQTFAGKTGTTGRYDIWFIGYSPDVLAGVWLGDDLNQRPLGAQVSGGEDALAVWLAWMGARPATEMPPKVPSNISFYPIDLSTGLLAHPAAPHALLPFITGTQPTRQAPSPTHKQALDAERLERDL